MLEWESSDKKYRVTFTEKGELTAYRYTEHWRDLTGDNLVLSMLQDLADLTEKLAAEGEARRHRAK